MKRMWQPSLFDAPAPPFCRCIQCGARSGEFCKPGCPSKPSIAKTRGTDPPPPPPVAKRAAS
jgi:hypothetical protein